MDLKWVKLTGYKRFENTILRTPGKITALVGPNEAGKTSILHALQSLNHDSFSQGELTRYLENNSNNAVLESSFWLNDEDRKAISECCS